MPRPDPFRKTRTLPELLAPAGSPEAFRAAIAAGADAVYLSGKRFGARRFAPNFTDAEIEEAIRLAHMHGVRVYVTVNTLVYDREIPGVLEYLAWLYAAGVDAVLVQDTGIAALAHEIIPGLTLHASTQMTIHNSEGVRWAKEQGFSRVVLARELSLDEVREIADETKDTGIGLEVFAHGALCYGYSGQCLLSSVIGGRSGNRGMCAQPCRKPWTLVTGTVDEYGRPGRLRDLPAQDHYLLSPKDLCTYRHLPELVQSPVVSLKIEGRMKSPEYVAVVVSTYRRALDAIAAGPWQPSGADEQDLLLAFNRGFTEGYLFGQRHGKLMGRDAPDNRGLRIGTVIRYDRDQSRAVIRPEGSLVPEPGDGLLVSHPDRQGETGFALNAQPELFNGELRMRVPRPVPAGSVVYLTSSRELAARARQLLAKPGPGLSRPLPVDLTARLTPDGKLVISGSLERPDGTMVPVPCRPEAVLAPAQSRPLTKEVLAKQLEKSGGTPFTVRSLSIEYDGTRFAPLAEINRMRREFFAAATEHLVASYLPAEPEVRRARQRLAEEASRSPGISGNRIPAVTGPLRIGFYVDTIAGVREAAASGAGTICFEPDLFLPPAACGNEGTIISPRPLLEEAIGICRDAGVPLIWKLPRITLDRFLKAVLPDLAGLVAQGLAGCRVENPGAARAVRAACAGVPLSGSSGLNIFNHAAAVAAGPLFSLVTLSPELSKDEIALLISRLRSRQPAPACALIVQGTSEVMVTEDCLRKLSAPCAGMTEEPDPTRRFMGIRDESGQVFPVLRGSGCQTRIGNSRELCLAGYLPALHAAGISEVVIDARNRPPRYIRTMGRIYRDAAVVTGTGSENAGKDVLSGPIKSGLKDSTLGGITTGHYLRGLKE